MLEQNLADQSIMKKNFSFFFYFARERHRMNPHIMCVNMWKNVLLSSPFGERKKKFWTWYASGNSLWSSWLFSSDAVLVCIVVVSKQRIMYLNMYISCMRGYFIPIRRYRYPSPTSKSFAVFFALFFCFAVVFPRI